MVLRITGQSGSSERSSGFPFCPPYGGSRNGGLNMIPIIDIVFLLIMLR
jgi:hypothetical protein